MKVGKNSFSAPKCRTGFHAAAGRAKPDGEQNDISPANGGVVFVRHERSARQQRLAFESGQKGAGYAEAFGSVHSRGASLVPRHSDYGMLNPRSQ